MKRKMTFYLISLSLLLVCCQIAEARVQWKRVTLPGPNNGNQQTACIVVDLDKDGIQDFVVTERTKTPSVVWYKYNGGTWDMQVIEDTHLKPEAGGTTYDVDQDGDIDVIFGQDASGNQIWWWENPYPDFSRPWKRHLIKNSGKSKHHDQTVGDFDGDGHPDVLGTEGVGAAKNTNFVWAQNDGKGRFTIHKNINYTGGGDFLQGCTAARIGKTIRVALSWHRDGGGIYTLNVPAKPAADTWTTTLLSTTVSTPPQGGDLNIISVGWNNPRIWIYENL
jgi:hypothetical protein